MSPDRELALGQLRARRRRARVEFDPVTGSPKSIEADGEFLSDSNGVGGSVSASAAQAFAPSDRDRATKAFLQEYRGLFQYGPEVLDSARVTRDYTTTHNGLRTVVWQQQLDGIPVFDAVLISHTTRRGELVNLSSQFLPDAGGAVQRGGQNRANLTPSLQFTAAQALVIAATGIGEQLAEQQIVPQTSATEVQSDPARKQVFRAPLLKGDATVSLTWLPMNPSQARLCWEVILMGKSSGQMFRVLVDTATGEALVRRCLTTDISDATYRVYTSDSPTPFSPGFSTPTTAQPPTVDRSLVTLPALDTNASPDGWIDDAVNETRGNNVDAHTDLNGDDVPDLPRPQGSPFHVFDFPLDLTTEPTNYSQAAVVQLFYWCNWMHDQLYDLGFTEAAGNFQNNNFNRGGVGNDAIQADAQDGSGVNNANFSTPPDGSPGRMQIYQFTGTSPNRDADLDAEIILHEYTHGLSNRRVGGGVGISILQPEGMGEGWSDFFALSLLSEPGDDVDGNYAMGAYSTHDYYFGIRRYPYSTDLTKNPLTFKDIDVTQFSTHPGIPTHSNLAPPNEVHNMGEVWCVTLWDARANLIRKDGWTVANRLILQLVTDGMALSPPNPTFLQARDAILQADMVDTGGANQVELWEAFAKRGMGVTATCPANTTTTGIQESYDVPDDLQVSPFSGGNFSFQSSTISGPNCLTYQLSNVGSNALQWSATVTAPWISLDVSNGVVDPGNSNAVTVCLNPTANQLFGGDYFGSVVFLNTVSGFTQIRAISLHLTPPQVLFNSLDTQPAWSFNGEWQFGQPAGLGGAQYGHPDPTAGATGTNVFGINLNGDYSLAVGNSNYLTAGPFDFTGVTDVSLHFQRWLNSDFQPYVFETIEGSTDGTNWNPVWDNGTTGPTADSSWTPVSYDISAWADNHTNVYLRWGHRVASTLAFPYSGWNIDDIEFWGNPPPRLSVSIPSAVDVSSGVQTGTVTVVPSPLTNLVVTLASSDAALAGVPDSVLIPAGASNAVFTLQPTNELFALPSTTVTITAAAGGYLAGAGEIDLSDSNEVALHLSLPATVTEGDGSVAGAVTIRDPQTNDVSVELVSTDPSSLQVPDSVTIAQGQTNAVFSATIIDDNAINGSRSVTVTAGSSGWTNGVATVLVQDNESLNLMVTAPANAWENAGVLSNAGIVSISGTLTTDLVVSLRSSVPVRLTVPDNITITAGQTSASFDITLIDNLVSDGNQAVNIGASAVGFTNGSASITVLDDETPLVPSNPSPPNLATNVDPVVALAWSDGSFPGSITNDVYFGTNPTPDAAELLGSTTNQTWTLPLLAPQTTYYWQIIAHHTGVTTGPVWQFTTRGADHFTWSPVSSPQYVNQPFAVTIVAWDAHDSVVSNFTGTVQLQGSPAEISPATSGTFVDGVWQGNVTVEQPASGESLTADDGVGHTGASAQFDVLLTNDVAISISASTNPAPVGAPLTYTLTVTNTGADIATDVQVTDLLPPRAIVNSVTVSQGSWNKTNDVLTADLGTIPGATNATVTIELTPTTFGDVLTNVASVTRAESDGYPDNNVATKRTRVGSPALFISDTATPEGNGGTTNASFVVRLSAPSSNTVTVIYSTADDSALAGSDYLGTNGVLVLPPGATNAVISVAVLDNVAADAARDFEVNLSDPTNAVIARAQATGTILNGDASAANLDHFDWSVIPSPQQTKQSFDVTVTALDSGGELVATFTQLVAFSTSIGDVRSHPAVSGAFTNGVWQGQFTVDDSTSGLVLKADDFSGHTGLSTAFDVVPYNMPPAILSSPIGSVVTNGSAVAFSVVAAGTPPLSYQWTINGTNVIDATNSTLTLTNVQMADSGEYAVQVVNAFGMEQSSNAVLTAGDPPVITDQPTNQTVVIGTDASFTATATGTEPLNYQWSLEGADLAGATNATLIVSNAQLADAGSYVVRVFNPFGAQTSSNATLSVGLAAKVTTQPTNLVLATGSDAAFVVEVDGTTPLAFQWSFNGTNIIDATNSSLVLTNVQMTNAGEYAVQVVNAFGTDQSSNAVLTVGDPASITGQPTDQTVVLGTGASFAVTATGTAPLSYQWSHEGSDLPDATNATLTISNAQLTDAGIYTVRVFNLFGTQTSSNALLTVGILPSVTTQPTNAAVAVGSNVLFTITADGTAPLTFQWTFNGTNLVDATNSSLVLTNVQMTNAGEYAVQVANAFGTDQSSNVVLAVGDPASITSQPINQTVVLGTGASFTVTATGTDPLNYQWSHDGTDLPDATNSALTIQSAQLTDTGIYAVRVFNLFGTQTSSNALLTVGLLPSVTTQPTNAAIAVGSNVLFTITADGTAPLTFQWTFNGTNITDATNSSLVLTNVQTTNAGEYAVQVVNAFGTDQSSNAVLTVGDPASITSQPIDQTVVLGTGASFTVTATGTDPLNYQWSHDGTDLPDATNATLNISSAQLADAGNYAVRVFNLFGTQTSSNALLTVGVLPSVTAQPTNATVTVGSDVTFAITAEGTAPLAFQWTFNGTNITDATNSSLVLTNMQMIDAGLYAVQVFNAFGTTESSNAVLDVIPACTPPPSGLVGWWSADGSAADSVTGMAGSITNITFVPGKVDLAFQFNGTNSAVNLGDPSSLKFTNSFSIEAWIWINSLPSAQQGQAQIFFRGQSDPCLDPYFLSLTADGTLRFHISDGSEAPCGVDLYTTAVATGQWLHVAAVLDTTNQTMSVFLNGELAAQTNTTMLPFADLQDGGAVIGNRVNQDSSAEPFDGMIDEVSAYNRALSIEEIQAIHDSGSGGKCPLPPALLVQPVDLTVAAGSNVVLQSAASGSPPLFFQWSLNGTNILGATNSVLTLTNAQSADAGQYVVMVANAGGSISSAPIALTVVLPPVIVSQPTNQSLPAGTTAILSVTADGTAPFHYQWRRGNVDLIDNHTVLGVNSSTLIISNVQPTDSDSYSVVITNLAGTAISSNATLTVYAVDHFVWDPIPAGRFVNIAFPVRIQALDISNNVVTTFPGPVLFTTVAGDPVQPQQSGSFTNGVWSGFLTLTQERPATVLIATDGLGHVGDANAFDVVDLPALTVQQNGQSMVISWSAYGPVFTPEISSDMINWSAAQLPIDLISTQYKIRVPVTTTNTFYRLRFIGP